MTYATLMLHLQLGVSNANLLKVAGDLAQRFRAGVIGIAACEPMQMVYGDGYISGDIMEQSRAEIGVQMKVVEAEFQSAMSSRIENSEWRSTVMNGSLSDYLVAQARSIDLFVTGVASLDYFDASRAADTADIIMKIGRPVLVVPPVAHQLALERVVVAWKDSREARRAICDALPLLRKAAHVTVVEIAADSELAAARSRLQDVTDWLSRHGTPAQTFAAVSTGNDALQLHAIAQEHGADVIVAGAYGHSRLREWALGGVTRELLLSTKLCSLLSH